MKTRKNISGKAPDSGCLPLFSSAVITSFPSGRYWAKRHVRHTCALLAAVLGLMFALPAQSATVYTHVATPLASAGTINSNAVVHADGSDQDVIAYDNFTLNKAANISSVTWRGASAGKGLAGFTIKIYASKPSPSAQPDTADPLAVISISGSANEKPVGNNLSDYHAEFAKPLVLMSGAQYWISIVSNRNDLSTWGWANGTGGDGKTIQSYSEFKILPAPGDRTFSLNDARSGASGY